MSDALIIATRKSKLALIQSEMIKAALLKSGVREVELLPLSTTGDREKDRELLAIGGKGLFTKEIEGALLDGRAHIAMHSLKDMPVEQPDGLMIAGVLPRDAAHDVLISHTPLQSLEDLAQGATIGTSSPRRAAQLLTLRPDLTIVPFRGNVPTRLKKIEQGEVDATILAAAGLSRLKLTPCYALPLPTLPAIGQGIIAIQCRTDDITTRQHIAHINHASSFAKMQAERAILREIEGDCHTPLAAHAAIEGEQLTIMAEILAHDGSQRAHATEIGPLTQAEQLGKTCAKTLIPQAKTLWQRCS